MCSAKAIATTIWSQANLTGNMVPNLVLPNSILYTREFNAFWVVTLFHHEAMVTLSQTRQG